MHFVDCDVVAGVVAGVCFAANLSADVHLGGESDYADADSVFDALFDRVVNVAWVACEEGAEDDDYFASAMGGRVVESCPGHVEGVLERGIAFGINASEVSNSRDVIVGVATHVADSGCDAISHAQDA